ncbi:MAG: SIMPL domain-containing protein [Natronomonas sp.]
MTSRTITTAGTARREREPDLATIEVTAIGEGGEPAIARAETRDRSETIRESVTAVSRDQIQTVDIEVDETDSMFGPDVDAEYYGEERLEIECLPDAAEDVVIDVTNTGGTIQTVEFGLHKDIHDQLQDEALTAAMDRAREKAERLATSEGMTIAGVQTISTTGTATGMDGIVDEALNGTPDTGFSPTPVVVSESVEVVYELTDE